MFSVYCRVDERAKVCFEDSLEPSKDEVSPRCCIDEESQMERDQVFGERVTVDSRVHCSLPDESVGVGVH
jgi:hypothetical protein